MDSNCLDREIPDEPGLVSGSFAQVVTNNLVTRSLPEISDESEITEALNAPTRVWVRAGPVLANGYEWWAVRPEGEPERGGGGGWVAAAGKDGEEWLRPLPRRAGTWTVIQRRDVLGAIPRAHRAAVGADGRIYFAGGKRGDSFDSNPLDQVLAFHPGTCEWDELTPMPVAHEGPHVVQAPDGRLHVIAPPDGMSGDDERAYSDHLVSSVSLDSWEGLARHPDFVDYGSAVVADSKGRIWTFGWDGIYREDGDGWTSIRRPDNWPDPPSVDSALLEDDGSFALLFGGAQGIWRFDADSGELSLIAKPRVAHYNAHVARLADGTLVVGGGYLAGPCTVAEPPDSREPPADSYPLLDSFSPTTGEWTSISPLRLELSAQGGSDPVPLVVDGVLYLTYVEERWNWGGSEPFIERAELVIARFTPTRSGSGVVAEPGPGGCGG